MNSNNAWKGFLGETWKETINVSDFILHNYTEYQGDSDFLEGATPKTLGLLNQYKALQKLEAERGGVLDVNTEVASSLNTYPPAYLDRDNELIVGFQTDAPLKRGVQPFGGMRMAKEAAEAYGYALDPELEKQFTYRTTHNDGVYRVYTPEMVFARKSGIITGLPDAYGRGRIIGDYRRVALYGVDFLISEKQKDKFALGLNLMDADNIRQMEEVYSQIDFLKKLKVMAESYGFDISIPAKNALEATQWTYFAYLAAIREQNGAAMSLGRVSTFLDIYFERDLRDGVLTEVEAQEIMDQFILKLRMARILRTPEYNEGFGGDPMWITEAVGGMALNGNSLVTKNSYRVLNTLYNLEPAPEPNLTVLWSEELPAHFKDFCAKASIDTDAIQYENDDLMRATYGDDYAIACCVSGMTVGKQMQYFGARCNLAKLLLFALNGGRDEISGKQVGPVGEIYPKEYLEYDEVLAIFKEYQVWLAKLYVNTMNVIHYMHDKYAYEKIQMALHDTQVERLMAFGIAGLSVVTDSLSAIRYGRVKTVRNEEGLIVDYITEGDFPKYGNDDDRVDQIAVELVQNFYNDLTKTPAYRNARHTLSILTITSNVTYGKKTGPTPDGRKGGEAFAPGANPMHNREISGALAAINSVAKLPYACCQDGISNTFSMVPEALGKNEGERIDNLVRILDGYFEQNAHHINVNVLNRDKLIDAYHHPENYPNLTIRVSGYAVNFTRLSRPQQWEVIQRTFHEKM